MPGAPGAAPSSLVGIWSHHVVDPASGQYIAIIFQVFDATGGVHTRDYTPMGTIDLYGTYQILNGGADTRITTTDWSPKQRCTLVCSASPSPVPLNQPQDFQTVYAGPDVVYFSGDQYTREQQLPP